MFPIPHIRRVPREVRPRGGRARPSPAPALLLAGLFCAVSASARADASDFAARVREDTRRLASYATRQVGAAEHARAQDDLLARIREIPGVRVWTHEFPVVAPVNEETYLEVAGDTLPGRHPMYPIWPDAARLNTTGPGGIHGRLVYVGDAAFERLPARSLRGQIAVMEMSAYAQYRRAFDHGAAAVIFLESESSAEPLASNQSLYKPRYYVRAGPLADALRAGAIPQARIVSRGRWATVTARNLYAAVVPPDAAGQRPYALVAPYDSMSRVLGVAPGADAALDCATLLNVLRDEARKPTRPLLFGFVDAYHINQLGMRQMAAMLAVTPNERTRRDYQKLDQADLKEYQAAVAELDALGDAETGFPKLHDRNAARYTRRYFKDAVGSGLLRLMTLQGSLRLVARRPETEATPAVREEAVAALVAAVSRLDGNHRAELTDAQRAEIAAVRSFLEDLPAPDSETPFPLEEARAHASALVEVCGGLIRARNRILEAAYSRDKQAAPELMPLARALWDRMADRVRGQWMEQERRVAFFDDLDRLRREIAAAFGVVDAAEERGLSPLVVGLDLSDCGVLVAPGAHCNYNRIDAIPKDFQRVLRAAVRRGDLWPPGSPERRLVNTDAIEGRVAGSGFLGRRALITSAAASFQLPGVTWVTDDAERQRVDSPNDRFEALDWARIEPQFAPTLQFLAWLFATNENELNPRIATDAAARWRHGMGRVVDVSAGETVPRVPRPGFLVTLVGTLRGDTDGIRASEFAWTGEDGSFRIPLLCADVNSLVANFNMAAFRLDDWGAFTESLSTAESLVTARLATTFSLRSKPGEQLPRAVSFECVELNGPSFFDARFLEPLKQGELLDAVRGGRPKQSHFSVDPGGQMWGLVERGVRWQLILRAGAGRVRTALLNALPDGRERRRSLRETFQRGFPMDEPLPSIPEHISAGDIARLNEWRLQDFRSAGIASKTIDEIRVATKEALTAAEAARAADDGAALRKASTEALANEIRAYQAVRDMGLDIARGAIFLMLMMVPFSVAMERLIFACSRIGRQIAASIAIFALMALLLWSFHPAFRISAQPIVIVMAFTILSLSVMVISIVLHRFKASVQEFQTLLAEGSGAKMGRGGLIGSAVFLGIANMRKRKVRTLLTGATIVLVTFALLCFSSASNYLDKKDFRVEGVRAEHPGVLIRRPTFGPLHWSGLPALKNLLLGHDAAFGARAWLTAGLGDALWRLRVLNPATGVYAPVRGALGLPPIENRLTGIDRVLENWPAFAEGGGCYLSKDTAAQLGVRPGDTVVLRGIELPVRGVFDPIHFEDKIAQLDGSSILPIDYGLQEQDWINRDTQEAIEQEMGALGGASSGEGAEQRIPANELIVIPTETAKTLGGTLRSVGLACATAEEAVAIADRLMHTLVYPIYYSHPNGGVHVVLSTPLIAVPPRNLAIPLTIAALIIFTTMLNSVSERKREIYVYTSLGLAPTHVGALFVAEALTYGLMGAVFGYVAGQATATALTHLGWMGGVTLNYSGTAVIKTILLVQGVVVLSAIVPAIVAGKIAAPSTETDWRVPDPVDGVICDRLPFTVSPAPAAGLVAFLHEYLEAHRDGVLGGFDIETVELLPPAPGIVAGLEARLWLAPFDMGVRQRLRLTVEPPEDGACAISVRIVHEAGAPKTWWRLNKPFLTDLRRQLLGWRKLGSERMLRYMRRAEDGIRASAGDPANRSHGIASHARG